ncbi:MAG: response regulator transcription factor [Rubrobacter sp.]|nr:response regulator transcription factor [Rubrobacter sp.]
MLVAEDHPLFRKGVISLLSSVPDFEVVGEVATGEEAVERAAELQPDVVLMDLKMPGMGGIEATREVFS